MNNRLTPPPLASAPVLSYPLGMSKCVICNQHPVSGNFPTTCHHCADYGPSYRLKELSKNMTGDDLKQANKYLRARSAQGNRKDFAQCLGSQVGPGKMFRY